MRLACAGGEVTGGSLIVLDEHVAESKGLLYVSYSSFKKDVCIFFFCI